MNLYDIAQIVVVALIVIASTWTAFAKLTPRLHNRLLAHIGAALAERRSPLLRRFGQYLGRSRPTAHCGSDDGGCSSCGSCGSGSDSALQSPGSDEKELRFHKH